MAFNVEDLVLTGEAAIDGTGNALTNVINGNGAANRIDGGAGNDSLEGASGADTMIGGTGDDVTLRPRRTGTSFATIQFAILTSRPASEAADFVVI